MTVERDMNSEKDRLSWDLLRLRAEVSDVRAEAAEAWAKRAAAMREVRRAERLLAMLRARPEFRVGRLGYMAGQVALAFFGIFFWLRAVYFPPPFGQLDTWVRVSLEVYMYLYPPLVVFSLGLAGSAFFVARIRGWDAIAEGQETEEVL